MILTRVLTVSIVSISLWPCTAQAKTPQESGPQPLKASISAEGSAATGEVIVVIQNNRNTPMEAWSFEVRYSSRISAEESYVITTDAFTSLAFNTSPDTGPIAPASRREIRVATPGLVSLKGAELRFALYSDMTFSGSSVVRSEVLAQRDTQATEFEALIQELDSALTKGTSGGRQSLKDALKRRRETPGRETFAKGLDRGCPAGC